MNEPNPVDLYRRATARAIAVAQTVRPDQLGRPTPCAAWSVQDLLDHLVGGTRYLQAALTGAEPVVVIGAGASDFQAGVEDCLAGLAAPGALDRKCTSPLGFEWTVMEATAGTFMDVLVHTWDLATATGQPNNLDPELVDACIALFLPDMPAHGRAAGLVGPEVALGADASAQDRLLGAMGRSAWPET